MSQRTFRKRFKCRVCGLRSNFVFKNKFSIDANGVVTRWVRVRCPKCFSEGLFVWNKRRAQLSMSFWFVLTLLLVLVVAVIFFVNAPDVPVATNSSVNVSAVDVFLQSNGDVSYNVFFNGSRVSHGRMVFGKLEFVGQFFPFSVLNISGGSDSFYFNSSSCVVQNVSSICVLSLDRKASNYSVSLSDKGLSFVVPFGVVQSPTACFSWVYGVDNVLMDFPSAPKPNSLKYVVDSCFLLPSIDSDYFFDVDYHYNSFISGAPRSVSVYVSDFEVDGFLNIGLRNASKS